MRKRTKNTYKAYHSELNFLRRNRLVLRRKTTTGRELPENAIETILSYKHTLKNQS
jgi:hypothetical protein